MFDRLIDFLVSIVESIRPWVVIREYQRGVQLRLGKLHRELQPGLHWVIPFADHVEEVVVVWTTITLPAQTVVTSDGRLVTVKGMVKCRVTDPVKYTIEAYDAKDALSDTTCGVIYQAISNRTYEECRNDSLAEDIDKLAKREAKKWGITVGKVTLTDMGEVMSFRLFNEGSQLG